MKSVEEVCMGLIRGPGFAKKILVGMALGAIPVINFLAFGYLLRIGKRECGEDDFGLPEWQLSKNGVKNSLQEAFSAGVVAFIEFFLTVGIAMLVCSSIFACVGKEKFGLCVGLFIGAPAFACAAIVRAPSTENGFAWLSQMASGVYKLIALNWGKLLVPSLLFLCFQIIAFLVVPIIFMGAPLFLGFVFLIHCIRQID
ncbi:MAG: hypothetical protein LBI61_02300 [Puniceicoccales bacterium]|jgi:hypothetical protein|nr:hypothetical protein [Puniceicoccales bacterium]